VQRVARIERSEIRDQLYRVERPRWSAIRRGREGRLRHWSEDTLVTLCAGRV